MTISLRPAAPQQFANNGSGLHAVVSNMVSAILAKMGVTIKVVPKQGEAEGATLGHSQISLTLNTYSHVIPALGRAAADQMDEVLGSRSADVAAS